MSGGDGGAAHGGFREGEGRRVRGKMKNGTAHGASGRITAGARGQHVCNGARRAATCCAPTAACCACAACG